MKRVLWFLETYFTGVLMLVSSLMIFLQVVLRYVFSYSIIWVEEFARYSIVWFIFLGASLAVREGKHASVDVLIRLLPPRVQKFFDVLDIVISMIFTLVVLWFGIRMVVRIGQIGNITPALQIPMYIPYLAIPIGALMMTWRFLEKLLETLRAPAGQKEREAN
ncbi:MAG: TRAP transporter small permease [Spirochaetaceae bacterium]|nr:MAG: TRAP transporter small permease [Spirochaetaceae bacterium]